MVVAATGIWHGSGGVLAAGVGVCGGVPAPRCSGTTGAPGGVGHPDLSLRCADTAKDNKLEPLISPEEVRTCSHDKTFQARSVRAAVLLDSDYEAAHGEDASEDTENDRRENSRKGLIGSN
jgi:hypothetical protein